MQQRLLSGTQQQRLLWPGQCRIATPGPGEESAQLYVGPSRWSGPSPCMLLCSFAVYLQTLQKAMALPLFHQNRLCSRQQPLTTAHAYNNIADIAAVTKANYEAARARAGGYQWPLAQSIEDWLVAMACLQQPSVIIKSECVSV